MIYFRGAKSLRFLSVFICYNGIVEKEKRGAPSESKALFSYEKGGESR